jgi:GNAT superfamily N-acetyltransferase
MQIKRLTASDATQYRALMLQAYELAADAFTSTVEERAAEPDAFWIKRIGEPTGLGAVFGAFNDTALVGTVALEFSAKPKTMHKALVIGMYVVPEARGTGASRGLLAAAIDCAKAREGMRQLTLTLTEGNDPALHLYQKAGFESFGVEPAAILTPEGYKAKVHMWLRLRDDTV